MPAPFAADLFVSYAEADRAWVEGYLSSALEPFGLQCSFQRLPSHTNTPAEIEHTRQMADLLPPFEQALTTSRYTLLVLSPAYLGSYFGQAFARLAISNSMVTERWNVIPIILQPVQLPPYLMQLACLDATNPHNWPRLVKQLHTDLSQLHIVPCLSSIAGTRNY
jgi:TIR domain-containing protein